MKLSKNIVVYILLICISLNSSYGQSIARNKSVTLSLLPGNTKKWDKSGVVDGNYDRNATCKCCASTEKEMDPWIEIDLGKVNNFTRIVVYGRTDFDSGANRINNLAVEFDNNTVSVHITKYWYDSYFFHIDLGQTTSARKIKLTSKGSDKRLVLCEVDVFDDSVISTRKAIEASSTYNNCQPSNAVDGLIRTNDPDVCLCAATQAETDPWFKLDLGDRFFITLIKLYGRTDGNTTGQSFEGMRIDIDDIYTHTIPTGNHTNYYELFPTPDKIGRYINLTLTGENRVLTVCEMVVYGERVISINKNVVQSSRYKNWYASKAVDGKYITHHPYRCECCSGTKYEQDPWLKVDLGPNHEISRIVIYGRTDGSYSNQSFVDMNIQLDSNLLHTIPDPPANWVDFFGFQLPSVQAGRNITLTLQGGREQLVICELVIYGDCVDGYFGENCDQQCHCKGELCNNITGICPSGICEPGIQGDTCSEQCNNASYGQNCTETCGKCKNTEVCNFTSGLCKDCEDGYNLDDKTCKTKCSGSYGYNCTNTCGNCRDDKPCNITNGRCEACADGYKLADRICKTMCDNGTYGYNCTGLCGKCRSAEVCNKVNGRCNRCEDGYAETDLTCKTKCSNSTYGQNCSSKCGACKGSAPCHFVNGTCQGCSDGFYLTDNLCNTGCAAHTYGYNCSRRCGQCRDTVPCNPENGKCTACAAGYNYTDPLCNTICNLGFYGFDCQESCGNCFGEEVCHHVNGSCSRCSEGFVGTTCAERIDSGKSEAPNSGGVIAGAIVAVIVVLIIGVVVFLRKRRQLNRQANNMEQPERQKPASEREYLQVNNGMFDNAGQLPSNVNETLKDTPEKADVNHDYYNVTLTPGILVHDLWEYISKNKENEGEGFGIEFKKLRDGLIFPHNDAIANKQKNRYKEMYPYDHSRVHLNVEEQGESEFINASHIDGFDETRKFIASQGPTEVMVDDFWRMVWQQNSTVIVMLTNLVEAEKQKCMQYWPDEGSVDFARITITLIQESDLSDYCVRTLDIQQDGGTPRRIRQFQFKAWPDKDVPDSTWSLTQFWREVFRDNNKERGPIVVHCSAGVGRTGTFIALDNLYHQAATTGKVTPFDIVENLRSQRVKMVQTSNQYMYLHEALADLMLFGTHFLWLSQFSTYYDFMIKKDKDLGKVRLRIQYEYLEKSLANAESKEGSQAAAPVNTVKEIDEYRPKLATSVDKDPGKFCTTFLPGLNGPDSFILTTLPNDRSLIECWRLINDHKVSTVITLTDDTKGTHRSIWSNVNDIECENYMPVLKDAKHKGQFYERQFSYTRQKKAQRKKREANIKQVEVPFPTKPVADTHGETILRLLDLVSSWQPHISPTKTVMIQCGDGVSKSGVLSVLLNEKQRTLGEGGQINILESVMMSRRADRSCISSFSQYKFIHDIMIQVAETKESASAQGEIEDLDIYQNV